MAEQEIRNTTGRPQNVLKNEYVISKKIEQEILWKL